ncbi:MAG: hypothetical protein LBK54_07935 [Propionibacteriaceae bacterium]|jgi:hypothetical protein|nr:hypothetical protein [Propionibacteriaceae bacterium]
MKKTSVYLDEPRRTRLAMTSERTSRSQSDLIKEGVDLVVERYGGGRRMMAPVVRSGRPLPDIDALLEGFGE